MKKPRKSHKVNRVEKVGQVHIPRTLAAARRAKLEPIDINFKEMAETEKSNWVSFDAIKSKSLVGSIAAIRRRSQTNPGPRPGTWIVCYYNSIDNQYDLGCHLVYSPYPPNEG